MSVRSSLCLSVCPAGHIVGDSPGNSTDAASVRCGLSVRSADALVVFTARCYASAVLAMGLCVRLSVTSRCSIETVERIKLGFGM